MQTSGNTEVEFKLDPDRSVYTILCHQPPSCQLIAATHAEYICLPARSKHDLQQITTWHSKVCAGVCNKSCRAASSVIVQRSSITAMLCSSLGMHITS